MTDRVHEAQREQAAAQAYIQANQRWNFCINLLVSAFWQFATSFIYGATVLSLYTSYLTDSAVLIGLIPAVQNAMFFFPQLLLARQAQTLARAKPYVVRLSLLERVPYLVVACSILLWPQAPSQVAYAILAFSLIVAMGGGGLVNPAWKAMIAKVVPIGRRGLLFGLSNAVGGLLGMGGAAISRQIFAHYDYPYSFGICFLLCGIFQLVSWGLMNLNREPAIEPTVLPPPSREYWRRLPSLLRQDRNFGRFLIARNLMILGGMGTSFYVVYARHAFGISDSFAANLTMMALLGQTVSTPLLGLFGDRRGNKLLFELSGLFLVVALALILLVRSEIWLYGVFMLVNISMAAGMISSTNISMEFGPSTEMPTYSALASTINAVPILLAPLMGGWLVDAWGYPAMFLLAVILNLVGMGYMHMLVRDPRLATEPKGQERENA